MKHLVLLATALVLTACGGGGGGGGGGNPPPAGNNPPPAPVEPSAQELRDAAAILNVGTFGPTYDEIDAAARQGVDAWLDSQFAMAPSWHLPIVSRYLDEYGYDMNADPHPGTFRRFAFWEQALTAPDQLRQLTAYALTQIFVVSDVVGTIFVDPSSTSSYYDMLLNNAFGNFRDILRDVTLHPVMGFYLSHVNNGRSNPAANTFPDENYAREVMQLFSIGLYELNEDGSWVLDGSGQPIPTYDNADIREFSKIFTGLSYGEGESGRTPFFGNGQPVFYVPMVMFENFHEPGVKNLLNGQVVPDGQTGMQDIEDAIDNLFNHPNVGPFIGKQLIQRLVTSNPSPEYVTRVTQAFNGDGGTPRGDMQTVLRAILTDPEAQSAMRLREPFRRYVAINRSLGAVGDDGTYPALGYVGQFLTGQNVLSAPSVFNFYLPTFSPAGPIKDQGMVAPEFQITDASTIIGVTNLIAYALFAEQSIDTPADFADITLDLSDYEALVDDTEGFMDRLDLQFFGGAMDAETRDILSDALEQQAGEDTLRTQVALYMALVSPDYAIVGGGQ